MEQVGKTHDKLWETRKAKMAFPAGLAEFLRCLAGWVLCMADTAAQ
jgi:hypothetical protein